MRVVSGSVIDERFQYAEVDLLYEVPIAGRDGYVFVLLEHQSTVDAMMPMRLLRYIGRIYDRYLRQNKGATRLPAIIPLVLSHAERPWTAPTSFAELIDLPDPTKRALAPQLVDFRFLLEDLAQVDAGALRQRHSLGAFARVVLFLLSRARRSENLWAELQSWRELLRTVARAPGGAEHTAILVVYMKQFAGVQEPAIREFLAMSSTPIRGQQ